MIQNINLTFPAQGMFFLLGPSGSGKTTLLNIIGCLLEPSSGHIFIGHSDPFTLSREQRELFRLSNFSFIFQEYNLVPDYDVLANLLLSKNIRNEPKSKNFDSIIRLCQIDSLFKRRPNQLSTGQKQRVCIARALINETPIILGDEPTGSVDARLSDEIFVLLKGVSKTRLVIIASHDRKAAFKYGDSVYEIQNRTIAPSKIPVPPSEAAAVSSTPTKHRTPFGFNLGLSFRGLFRHAPIYCLSLIISLLFGSAIAPLSSFFFGDLSARYVESLYLDGVNQIQFSAGQYSSNLNDSAVDVLSSVSGFVKVAFTVDDQFVPMDFPSGNHVDALSGIALYDDTVSERYPLLFGHLPSSDDREVLITSETYETLALYGFLDGTPVASFEDVVGHSLPAGTIAGIINTYASSTETISASQHNFYYINPDAISLFLSNPFSIIYRINANPQSYADYSIPDFADPQLTSAVQISGPSELDYRMLCDGHTEDEGFVLGAQSHFFEAYNAASESINNHISSVWNAEFATLFSQVSGIDNPSTSDYFQYIVTEKTINEVEEGMTYVYFFQSSTENLVETWPRTIDLLIQPYGSSYFKKESLNVIGYDFGTSETVLSSIPSNIFALYSSTMNGSISRLSYRLSGSLSKDQEAIKKTLKTTTMYPTCPEGETSFSLTEHDILPFDNSIYDSIVLETQQGNQLYNSILVISSAMVIGLFMIISALFFLSTMADRERNGILLSLGLSRKNLKLSYLLQAAAVAIISAIPLIFLSTFSIEVTNRIAFALTGLALFQFSYISTFIGVIMVFLIALSSMMIVNSRLNRLDVIDLVKRDI